MSMDDYEARYAVQSMIPQGATLLFAVEAGSRLWGVESPDSDYDVRGVYVRRREDYMTIWRHRDVIEREYKVGGFFGDAIKIRPVDVVLWDLPKALRLLRKSNPSILEWTSGEGPVYFDPFGIISDPGHAHPFRRLRRDSVNPRALYCHYMGMAQKHDGRYIRRGDATWKHLLYASRAILSARCVATRGTVPPMRYTNLLGTLRTHAHDEQLFAALHDTLQRKREGLESERAEGDNASYLVNWITAELENESRDEVRQAAMPDKERYDLVFTNLVAATELRRQTRTVLGPTPDGAFLDDCLDTPASGS